MDLDPGFMYTWPLKLERWAAVWTYSIVRVRDDIQAFPWMSSDLMQGFFKLSEVSTSEYKREL